MRLSGARASRLANGLNVRYHRHAPPGHCFRAGSHSDEAGRIASPRSIPFSQVMSIAEPFRGPDTRKRRAEYHTLQTADNSPVHALSLNPAGADRHGSHPTLYPQVLHPDSG